MTTCFGVFRADGMVIGADARDASFPEVHHDAFCGMRTLYAKYHRNHPDYEGGKAIGFFYIDEEHPDIVRLFEDCVGDKSVSDLLAKLRDTYPEVEVCEKRIAELKTTEQPDDQSDEKTKKQEGDAMAKQIIYDITNAVKLKYDKTTEWVWGGVTNALFRPAKKHECPSLEIEHYEVVYEFATQDENSAPFTDEIHIGEALSLDRNYPFLFRIKGRNYYRQKGRWANIPMGGNEVIDSELYLDSAASARCPDGWVGDLPDYICFNEQLYRSETVEEEE